MRVGQGSLHDYIHNVTVLTTCSVPTAGDLNSSVQNKETLFQNSVNKIVFLVDMKGIEYNPIAPNGQS